MVQERRSVDLSAVDSSNKLNSLLRGFSSNKHYQESDLCSRCHQGGFCRPQGHQGGSFCPEVIWVLWLVGGRLGWAATQAKRLEYKI